MRDTAMRVALAVFRRAEARPGMLEPRKLAYAAFRATTRLMRPTIYGVEGLTYYYRSGWRIEVSPDLCRAHRAFVVAHETAEIALDELAVVAPRPEPLCDLVAWMLLDDRHSAELRPLVRGIMASTIRSSDIAPR